MEWIKWWIARQRRRRAVMQRVSPITPGQWELYLYNQHSRDKREHARYASNTQ